MRKFPSSTLRKPTRRWRALPRRSSHGATPLSATALPSPRSALGAAAFLLTALVRSFIDEFKKLKGVAEDISCQMGKPLQEARNEINTMIARTEALIQLAPAALKDDVILPPGSAPPLLKKIAKEPVGVVLSLQPWNYPLLTAVNSTLSAVLAGCTVLLKHSDRTPLCAEHFSAAFRAAGAPEGLVTVRSAPWRLLLSLAAHSKRLHVCRRCMPITIWSRR